LLFENSQDFARRLDQEDPLKDFRDEFFIPKTPSGEDCLYLSGNSLGLQPKSVKEYIQIELDDWARLGVKGHFEAQNPWYPYHEFLTEKTAQLVGAKGHEVVVMNSLTVNLHLMLISCYQPTKSRYKILVEAGAFPSDHYAVTSHAKFHGVDPKAAICLLEPRSGEDLLRLNDILSCIDEKGDELALILFGNVNFLTGQALDMKTISQKAHEKGVFVGFDLAHSAGNLDLALHEMGPDFAIWCSYKYLNGGPGTIGGCFVHDRHAQNFDLPRLAGWWGHNKKTRFQMSPKFDPMEGAEGWQLSNPPILPLAALRASMDIFDWAGMAKISEKRNRLTGFFEFLLHELNREYSGFCRLVTPQDPEQRGSQVSFRVSKNPRQLVKTLEGEGVICDFREPDIVRCAPIPLYNQYMDVYRFVEKLGNHAAK